MFIHGFDCFKRSHNLNYKIEDMDIFRLKGKLNSIKLLMLLLFGLSCLTLSSQSSTLKYRILHKGKVMGSLETTRVKTNDSVRYNSYVDIEYHLLATIRIQHQNSTVYLNDILWHSKVLSEVGKKGKNISEVKKTKEGYVYTKNSDKPISINQSISFSVERLFFDEPIGLSKVFSEEKGEFHKIETSGTHQYTKTAPNGHKSVYHYKNGILVKTEIDAGIIEFEMVLSD